MMKNPHIPILILTALLAACSTTRNIPDDDQLFIGLTDIRYENYEKGDNFDETRAEVDAALATAPNGALFGSSYYRTPFPYGLWIWNAYADKEDKFSKWMVSTFGTKPVLMSWVNPELRASVAQSVLRNHGYFQGRVGYETLTRKNPKKAKIGYTVDVGPLYTYDSIAYVNFPARQDSLVRSTLADAAIHRGDAFTVASLDAERSRLSRLFRNNGYYYYQPGYASYLADTLQVPGRAQLRLRLSDSISADAVRPWYIGRVTIDLRNSFNSELTDSVSRRFFKVRYRGSRPPVRPRVVMSNVRLRPRRLYSYDDYQLSVSRLNATGLFSMTDFTFTPRRKASVASAADDLTADTLDLKVNCVLEKPYDFYVETHFNGRTIGRYGPELRMGLTKRNAFRGGEKLDVNLHGSYEWMTGGSLSSSYYEYGADASIEFPRILAPFFGGNLASRDKSSGSSVRRRHRTFFSTPSTLAKFSTNVLQRPGYYKMHVVSGEWTYRWQPSASSHHEFSPLVMKYQFMNYRSASLDSILNVNPYLATTMQDYCIPSMRYSFYYNSAATHRNPVHLEATLSEAGNLLSLGMAAAGRGWTKKDKQLFKNPYSQFLRLESDFTKTWRLGTSSSLVGHLSAGIIYSYGNADYAPFSERFYVGGANSVRAFPVRGIGPGRFPGLDDKQFSYLVQNGDVKFLANLEHRFRMFGNLHGALFLDAGNVWTLRDESIDGEEGAFSADTQFRFRDFFRQLAVGTGFGLRYDLDFLIIRVDWGVGLHVPYATGKSGFYNVDGFQKNQTLHFAIGYPF